MEALYCLLRLVLSGSLEMKPGALSVPALGASEGHAFRIEPRKPVLDPPSEKEIVAVDPLGGLHLWEVG